MFENKDNVKKINNIIKEINNFFDKNDIVNFRIEKIDFDSIVILAKSINKTMEITFKEILAIKLLFNWNSSTNFMQFIPYNKRDNVHQFKFSNHENQDLFIISNKIDFKIFRISKSISINKK